MREMHDGLDPDGNPDQVDLFDQHGRMVIEREAQVKTEEAIARATANAKEQWLANAFEALCHVARLVSTFTSADVWDELRRRGVDDPPEPRAMAAVMRRAQKHSIAEPTDRYVTAKSKDRHVSSLRVWASTIAREHS